MTLLIARLRHKLGFDSVTCFSIIKVHITINTCLQKRTKRKRNKGMPDESKKKKKKENKRNWEVIGRFFYLFVNLFDRENIINSGSCRKI